MLTPIDTNMSNGLSKILLVYISLLFVFIGGLLPSMVKAAGTASLSLVSSKRTYTVGDNFTASVILSTGGVSINAASATITFDQSKLSVVSVARSGSVFTLWAEEPTFSNSQGIISFGGGLPTPGFSGSGATLIRVAFRAKAAGQTAVRFSSGTVLANDGKGTNVLAGLGSLELTIAAATAPPSTPIPAQPERAPTTTPAGEVPVAPVIVSRTHPDDSRWYKNTTPGFIWELPTDAKGVSVSIDQNLEGDPGTKSLGLFNFYTAKEPLKDGVWYAHVRLSNSRGWGATGHYKIAIDTSPPTITSAKIVSEAARARAIEFSTTDKLSSTDHVAIMLDGEEIATAASSPYTLPSLSAGNHVITITAVDKAGNKGAEDLYLSIIGAEPSVITVRNILPTILALLLAIILAVVFVVWYIHERHHRKVILTELAKTRKELKGMSQKLRALENKLKTNANNTNLNAPPAKTQSQNVPPAKP